MTDRSASRRAWAFVFAVAASATASGCHKKAPPSVAPGVGYGCITSLRGTALGCEELDGGATADQRMAFGNACLTPQLRTMQGMVVEHCRATDIAAECAIASTRTTLRYYRDEMTDDGARGATMACKVRGGTYRTY